MSEPSKTPVSDAIDAIVSDLMPLLAARRDYQRLPQEEMPDNLRGVAVDCEAIRLVAALSALLQTGRS